MYVLRRYHPDGALPRIPVWGPAGVAQRMATAYDLPEPGMTEEFAFHEYAGAVELGPFRVEPHAVEHPVPAYGFRVTAGGRSSPTPVTPACARRSTTSPRTSTSC